MQSFAFDGFLKRISFVVFGSVMFPLFSGAAFRGRLLIGGCQVKSSQKVAHDTELRMSGTVTWPH